MDAIDLLIASRIKLMSQHAFWGYLCLNLNFIHDERVSTIGIDESGRCFYSDKFVRDNKDKMTTILAHEIGHPMLEHHKRKGRRNIVIVATNPVTKRVEKTLLWNLACVDKDTDILMIDGSAKKIQDIRPNEIILGYDVEKGEFVSSLVLDRLEREVDEIYEVNAEKRRLICSADHKFLTKNGEYIQAQHLISKDMEVSMVERYDIPDQIQVEESGNSLFEGKLSEEDNKRVSSRLEEDLQGDKSKGKFIKAERFDNDKEYYSNEGAYPKIREQTVGLFSRINRWGRNDIDKENREEIFHSDIRDDQYKFIPDGMARKSFAVQNKQILQWKRNSLFQDSDKRLGYRTGLGEVNSLFNSEKASGSSSKRVYTIKERTESKGQTHKRDGRSLPESANLKLKRSRISGIEKKSGRRVLYDLVTTTHNYIANSFVVHNCDYALNLMLKETFNLPEWCLMDERFKGMAAEEIYDILKKEMKASMEKGEGKGSKGNPMDGGFDAHVWVYDAEDELGMGNSRKKGLSKKPSNFKAKNWSKLREEAEAWASREKSKGDVQAGLEREIDSFIEMKYDWDYLIRKAVVNLIRGDYTFKRPHRSYYSTGIYLPSMAKTEGVRMASGIDTSGSVSKEELTLYTSLLKSIFEEYKDYVELYLCDCDAKTYNLEKAVNNIDDFYEFCKKIKGGGGTDYRPIFNKIEEERWPVKLLIIFGDLMGDMPKERPQGYEVIWLVSEEGARPGSDWYERAKRIGEVIYIS